LTIEWYLSNLNWLNNIIVMTNQNITYWCINKMNEIKLRKFSLKNIQNVFETINNSKITKYFRFYGTNYQVVDIVFFNY
jgi:hypothetical protein